MKRRRFLQLAASAAAGAALHTPARASLHPHQEIFIAIRDRLAGPDDPIRVRSGERVRFHFLHAGDPEDVHLHLPGHRFTVVALDGYPVPTPAAVDVLSLTKGERIEALVEMSSPGNWILGALDDAARRRGPGVCIAYANGLGPAQWHPPAAVDWSYSRFSAPAFAVPAPSQIIEMLLEKKPGTEDGAIHWVIDGLSYPSIDHLSFPSGRRYRLRLMNATGQAHPVCLSRHPLELKRVNQIPVSGIIKGTLRLERYNVLEADLAI